MCGRNTGICADSSNASYSSDAGITGITGITCINLITVSSSKNIIACINSITANAAINSDAINTGKSYRITSITAIYARQRGIETGGEESRPSSEANSSIAVNNPKRA